MSKKAFVFPGQGSQYIGMGKDLYEKSEQAKDLFREAEETLGFKISEIMFAGPVDSLKQTEITQPAIFLHSLVLSKFITDRCADMTAGHSLGEYTSLVYADALDFSDALKLVRERGQAMQEAGEEQKGTMAAVIGLSPEKTEEACSEAGEVVQCANFNSPGQIVISGSVDGVKKAMALCKEKGARLVKELVVSGAFHSPLMAPAGERLKKSLDGTSFRNSKIPVYINVTAGPVTDSEEFKKLLFEQLTAPVKWEEIIRNMIADGAEEFYEIGPGKVLQGLIKRINPDVKTFGIEKYEDVENYIQD